MYKYPKALDKAREDLLRMGRWWEGLTTDEELDFWFDDASGNVNLKYYHPGLDALVKAGRGSHEVLSLVVVPIANAQTLEDGTWRDSFEPVRDELVARGRALRS